eukprot:1157727-Pelagomonas_calceolata.AAC.10
MASSYDLFARFQVHPLTRTAAKQVLSTFEKALALRALSLRTQFTLSRSRPAEGGHANIILAAMQAYFCCSATHAQAGSRHSWTPS